MVTRITGAALRPDGSAYANATFTFVRSPAIVVSQDGSVVTPLVTTVTANGAGAVDAIAKGLFTPLNGYTYQIGPKLYTGVTGSTAISDLPGLELVASGDAFTVATLPTASSSRRQRYFVTDATATTFYSVVSGGGSNQVPVWSDGTNWRIG